MRLPFRFAVQTSHAPSACEWRERARRIEGLGYSALLVADHLWDRFQSPTVLATAAASVTTTLKVGTHVLNNCFRNPVVMAKEMATIDVVSEGRLEVGIGAGWARDEFEQAGIDFEANGVRIDRLAETVSIVKSIWETGTATFRGRYYDVKDASGAPLPVARPHPPILIGGGGKRVLSLAAREAQIVGINSTIPHGCVDATMMASTTKGHYAQRIEWVREAASDRLDEIEIQIMAVATEISESRKQDMQPIADRCGVALEEALDIPNVLIGTVEEVCDLIVARRELYGASYWVFQENAIDSFAPVVSRLAGT